MSNSFYGTDSNLGQENKEIDSVVKSNINFCH